MVSFGSAEGLGLQLGEADGRGSGLRDQDGFGLGLKVGCQLPVGLGLGLVEGFGASEEPDGSGTGVTVCQPVAPGDGDTFGVEVVNGICVSDGSGALAIAGVTVMPMPAATMSESIAALSLIEPPP